MTARQQRRLEQRKARKQARKAPAAAPEVAAASPSPRAAINRASAQDEPAILREAKTQGRSTGPRTEAGKLASSRNSFKHGLYSKQLVLPSEDPAELDALRDDLRREHQPGTPTEAILVNELAEHYWRLRRMRKYEARVMGAGTVEDLHKGFAILPIIQRTMASAERGFHKALTALRQLQKERTIQSAAEEHHAEELHGFVSQNSPEIATASASPASQTDDLAPNHPSQTIIAAPEPEQYHLEAA